MSESDNGGNTSTGSSLGLTPLNRVLSPPLNLFPQDTPPDLYSSALAHFLAIPWCARLLRSPGVIPFIPQCVNPLSPSHDQLLGATLRSAPRGIPHVLCFFRPEDEGAHLRDPARPVTAVSSLFALGGGLCGWEGVLHGGVTMTMADEGMGVLHDINAALGKEGEVFSASSVTAGLEIRFLRPAPVEGAVVVNAWIEGVEGRKTRIRCEVRDGDGVELARCSSTWVSVRPKI